MSRIRKKVNVVCSSCEICYLKREDTLRNWNGMCFKCSNKYKVETSIKGKKRVNYNSCTNCGKKSYWIKTSSMCKECLVKNMPSGQNHYKWKHDRTKLAMRQERNDMAYKDWRKNVWERDNYKCQLDRDDCDGRIEAHHIIEWSIDESKRYDVNNGITLCKKHHPKKKKDVKDFEELFTSIVKCKINLN